MLYDVVTFVGLASNDDTELIQLKKSTQGTLVLNGYNGHVSILNSIFGTPPTELENFTY